MTSSNSYTFSLPNVGVVYEAFDRIGRRAPSIDGHMMQSARTSLNLELIEWENDGLIAWKQVSGTIPLVVNQTVYTLPTNVVTLLDVYYTYVAGTTTSDRLMSPIQRDDYVAITNKLQPGTPTQYWFQMLEAPQVTIWQAPSAGAPSYVLTWWGLQQVQDANIANGETPDTPRRSYEALCAKMALRLCEKFGPTGPSRAAMMIEKKAIADDAYSKLVNRDQEPGPIRFQPQISSYARMGR